MAEIASQQEAVEWSRIITDWPNYWDSVQRNYIGLINQGSFIRENFPNMLPWYNSRLERAASLYAKAKAINDSVNAIKNAWGTFTNWVKGMFGFSSLGVLPAIPLAITAAGAAATIYEIVNWLREAAQDARTIELLREAKAQGMTPSQAKEFVEKRGGATGGIFSQFRNFIPWLIIGGIVLLIAPNFLGKK